MINEERTFEEFGYVSGDLSRGSNRKVWAVCEGCGKEQIKVYNNYNRSKHKKCKRCAQKYVMRIIRGPFTIEYFTSIQESIDNGIIDELRTFKEFNYYSVDLSEHSNKPIYAICRICGLNRKVIYNIFNRSAGLCKGCNSVNINYYLREFDNPINIISGTHVNEYFTYNLYGYYSVELDTESNKLVIATCKTCGIERKLKYQTHTKSKRMCLKCSSKSDEKRRKLRYANIGKHVGKLNNMYGRRGKDAPAYNKRGVDSPNWKGGKGYSHARRRVQRDTLFGFIPHNKYKPNHDGHHLDFNHVLFIPARLHRSVHHSVVRNRRMDKINRKACNWYLKSQGLKSKVNRRSCRRYKTIRRNYY